MHLALQAAWRDGVLARHDFGGFGDRDPIAGINGQSRIKRISCLLQSFGFVLAECDGFRHIRKRDEDCAVRVWRQVCRITGHGLFSIKGREQCSKVALINTMVAA